jgi:hypothetical protein
MLRTASRLSLLMLLVPATTASLVAGETVPFKGTFVGQTVSAAPTDDPDVVFVTTQGDGQDTHLGRYAMVSPHLSNPVTLEAEGEQIFTAANGDLLTAEFAGQFVPTADGFLLGELEAVITGGTGRFEGATGSYIFNILFDPATFISIATIDGEISSVGANR